ncbi:alpha/beta hydrolase [Jejudonia soesokkakensis]|uniref:Alpha/beta hydrolase n=1 Tax=Jejudonia soesokkakensis TaxID=1323432 RepID=A0ABW2MUW3_9FLAO
MKVRIRTIQLLSFLWVAFFCLPSKAQPTIKKRAPFNIGERLTFDSKVLNEERALNIYLPNGYDKASEKKYPVIYLLDGSKDEDFIHIAGLVQFGSFSWINMIPETIVVGIENVDRKRDFTFPSENTLDREEFPTSGGSAKFIAFISEELQPLIQKTYNVSEEKTIISQSLGGLLASEILHKKPALFNNYIIVSPSVWWDDNSILKMEPTMDSSKKIYVAGGTEGPAMQTGAVNLYYKLREVYKDNGEVYYDFLKERDHGDALHLAVYNAFEKLFVATKE